MFHAMGWQGGAPMESIIERMRAAVAPGQRELDGASIRLLRSLTAALLAERRYDAIEEYDRFLGVTKRELCLPSHRLAQRLGGNVTLITGGTGCVGSTLVAQIAQFKPARIVSVSRGITSCWARHENAEYLHADIRNLAAISALVSDIKPDLIFHVASQRDPGLAETQVHQTVTTNILGTRNILDAAAANGCQVVCASTGKALRPFSPDTYTASKRVAEWVAWHPATSGGVPCSMARFSHIVDNSIIHQRLLEWADASAVIRLHSAQSAFYVQSAMESAQLLMLASLDIAPGGLNIHSITDLGSPISLLDLGLGVVAARRSDAPIYVSGYDPGYEEIAFPGLYDPETAGDVSPLINAFEAAAAVQASAPMTDTFRVEMTPGPQAGALLDTLFSVCESTEDNDRIRAALRSVSWELLNATLAAASPGALHRAVAMAEPHEAMLIPDHRRILDVIRASIAAR
jgi:nucleoside-diphosphate-sugar epimerase